jgi:undecaprenyl-diphosphatase
VGFLAQGLISGPLRSLWVVVALVGWSVVMWIAERVGKRDRPESSLNLKDAVIIGMVQCFALIPGVSRSGATISAGLLRDLNRVAATRLAFFLAIPALVAAATYEAIKEASVIRTGVGWLPTLLATGSALSSRTRQSPGCCDSWPSTASRCSSGIAWHWRRSSPCCSAQGC